MPPKTVHLDVVECLVNAGADLNMEQPMEKGLTPLHMASRKGHVDIVKYLICSRSEPEFG